MLTTEFLTKAILFRNKKFEDQNYKKKKEQLFEDQNSWVSLNKKGGLWCSMLYLYPMQQRNESGLHNIGH